MSDVEDRDERRIAERVAAAYRMPAPLDAGARERLDRALRGMPAPRRRSRLGSWIVDPLSARLRPVGAIAATLAILAVGAAAGRWLAPPRATPPAAPSERGAAVISTDEAPRIVQFVLVAPGASRVAVVGDFNGWDPGATPMERQGTVETWTARVPLLPGRHVYAFVTDGGRWVSDPQAPLAPANEFGFRNSVLIVGESEPL